MGPWTPLPWHLELSADAEARFRSDPVSAVERLAPRALRFLTGGIWIWLYSYVWGLTDCPGGPVFVCTGTVEMTVLCSAVHSRSPRKTTTGSLLSSLVMGTQCQGDSYVEIHLATGSKQASFTAFSFRRCNRYRYSVSLWFAKKTTIEVPIKKLL